MAQQLTLNHEPYVMIQAALNMSSPVMPVTSMHPGNSISAVSRPVRLISYSLHDSFAPSNQDLTLTASNMQRIQICSDLHIEKHTWGTVVRLTGPRLTCPTRWVHPRENLNKRTPELERPRRREEDEKNQCSLFLQPANCYFLNISPSIKLWPGIIHSVLLIYGFMHAYFYVSSVIHHSSFYRLHNKHLVCDGAPGSERWKTTWLLSSLLAGESCISNQTERACGGNLSCDLLQVWGRPWSGGM